ncbi:MAG: helicase-related protein [Dictyoglomaceae bacterium]|nr:helicase-related protein [Dictyoglomaceae bacterium]HPP16658.1 helicase-related protein [Dictyoglomaceae bacterium]HPU44017.1 helicase-related protein [Dictyoglomaceae bacterium]
MIEEGKIIKGPFWNESVKVDKVNELGDYIQIIGSTDSGKHIDQLIRKDDLSKIEILKDEIDFSASPENSFLVIEATRFKYASLFDPLLAMNVSKIDPLPFQIEAVYGYVLRQPRIRFLIADDPGAGKTIMAGLIIKELKLRRLARRILIVVPGHLKDQWRRELKEKFDEKFTVLDRNTFSATYGENPWNINDQVITSIDFSKQEEILPALHSVNWDLVVVDEAHKMAAYSYNNKVSKTQRYKLGEILSKTSNHLLFLTATPHKGDPENFRLFLDLLMPGFFASAEMVEESLKNKDNPLFIRRLKEDLRDFEGKPIFTRRFPKTVKFRLTDEEKSLYNDVSYYVREQYNRALADEKKKNVAFALMILQRRMASSTYALLKSLERRKEKLQKILNGEEKPENISVDLESLEDIEEEERWKKESEWESISLAKNSEELNQEIKKLDQLIEKVQEIIKNESEVKLKELRNAIEEGFKKIKEMNGNPKILIFTESKDTLDYLVKKIKSWGYKVNYIHGGMKIEERISAEKIFRDETEIMVATEAAGEGINLQFCHIMINYDIPWNPNRLEQRMGRIHRYGQQKDVYIFNLVAEDTIEGEVLIKLFDKLEEIREKLGTDRVFDIIGDIFFGKDLYQLILEAVTNARSMDEILKDLDIQQDEEYISKIKELFGESLATHVIDYTRIQEMAEKAKEYKLVPEYVEEFFKRAFTKAGGKFRELGKGFIAIDSIPYEIRKIAEDVNFKNMYGVLMSRYPKATFDKEIAFKNSDAEFISFGHPLLEALIQWIIDEFSEEVKRGSVFEDPDGRLDGFIWFYIGEVKDGKGEVAGRKIVAIYDNGRGYQEINPGILWNLSPSEVSDKIKVEVNQDVIPFVISAVENYKGEISKERERQAKVKERYGLKSLEYLINDLDAELSELYERQAMGERVDLPIRNKEEQKRGYEDAKIELEKEIKQEQSLSISMPKFLNVIRVIPKKSDMVEDEEIERIGMEIAMEYERKEGRIPEDVSKENLGFDIRSKGKNEVRYIEVKARVGEGDVALTQNEWFIAKRFKEQYWLYIVANAKGSPTLYIRNNPTENFTAEEKVEIVRYIIPFEEWKKKGDIVKWR